VRKQELKRLKKCLSTAEYKELKGAMWALRHPWDSLSEEKRQVLSKLFLIVTDSVDVTIHPKLLKIAFYYRKLEK
jgi:hypothetical protein